VLRGAAQQMLRTLPDKVPPKMRKAHEQGRSGIGPDG
jgi:hypothetical protein